MEYENIEAVKKILAALFKDIMDMDAVDPEKTLFDLGADSIKVIEIAYAINQKIGVKLSWESFNVVSSLNSTAEEIYSLQHAKL